MLTAIGPNSKTFILLEQAMLAIVENIHEEY